MLHLTPTCNAEEIIGHCFSGRPRSEGTHNSRPRHHRHANTSEVTRQEHTHGYVKHKHIARDFYDYCYHDTTTTTTAATTAATITTTAGAAAATATITTLKGTTVA